mmetsp:Transcript_57169/g.153049  ORF Transcript_57169/g.153049 Transcript_57169/m.153049 type:complete len:213 (-) Transcript_57169:100-738(-)
MPYLSGGALRLGGGLRVLHHGALARQPLGALRGDHAGLQLPEVREEGDALLRDLPHAGPRQGQGAGGGLGRERQARAGASRGPPALVLQDRSRRLEGRASAGAGGLPGAFVPPHGGAADREAPLGRPRLAFDPLGSGRHAARHEPRRPRLLRRAEDRGARRPACRRLPARRRRAADAAGRAAHAAGRRRRLESPGLAHEGEVLPHRHVGAAY